MFRVIGRIWGGGGGHVLKVPVFEDLVIGLNSFWPPITLEPSSKAWADDGGDCWFKLPERAALSAGLAGVQTN